MLQNQFDQVAADLKRQEDIRHDLQQRLAMSLKTNRVLVDLLQTHALNLEHCAALVETLLSPCGTQDSAFSPSVKTVSSVDWSGLRGMQDLHPQKPQSDLTERVNYPGQPPVKSSTPSTPKSAKRVRTGGRSNRRLVLDVNNPEREQTNPPKYVELKRTSSANRSKRKRK